MILCSKCGKEVNCKGCDHFARCKTRRANESTENYMSLLDHCMCAVCSKGG